MGQIGAQACTRCPHPAAAKANITARANPSPNRESQRQASDEEYNPAEEVLIRASQYILYLLNGGIFFVYVNSPFFSLDGDSAVSKPDSLKAKDTNTVADGQGYRHGN